MYAWTMLTEFNCQSATHVKNAVVYITVNAGYLAHALIILEKHLLKFTLFLSVGAYS